MVESLARSVEALTNDHQQRIQTMEEVVNRVTRVEEGLTRMLIAIDALPPSIDTAGEINICLQKDEQMWKISFVRSWYGTIS
ncbi:MULTISPECIES: hypothetical protein [unclassified Moorena]|uniref:hypothetical protein n=1 Tax=unclassified Moorena TaxID=2683338 RepID=UPI0013C69DED|nr:MULTISPECIES: hypothetical protein [unclassified Moorena]NEO21097.1 hypothetical protein [Moorena sp. SIO4A5]NEQ59688.1 hypothetical protein [Moorena sp. SIO4A1]